MENKDDLISRRAVLDAIREDIGMNGTYDLVEALPGQMTAEEAWKIARKIVCNTKDGGLSDVDMDAIFGDRFTEDIFRDFTMEEIKAKIEAWEEQQLRHSDEAKKVDFRECVLKDFMKASRR